METPKAYEVIKVNNTWGVQGVGNGWIFEKTFPTKWRAHLALKVFNQGGRVSDYWHEARKGKEAAKKFKKLDLVESRRKRPRSRTRKYSSTIGVSVLKIACPNCDYCEIPLIHSQCESKKSPVLGRLLVTGQKARCEVCNTTIPLKSIRIWTCKKCSNKFNVDLQVETLLV